MSVTDARAARSQARQRFKFIYFAEKWIFSESPFLGKNFKKKFYILRLIVKEIFHFEVLSVTDARARAARSRCRYALNPPCILELFIDLESICSCLKNGVLSAGFH